MEARQAPKNNDKAAGTAPSSVSIPSISLPKGGGAIRGIGEKFAANPVTGAGSMSVPIYASSSRSGFGPQLSLTYRSGSDNGPFGFGWELELPAITRKTERGLPTYRDSTGTDDADVFILSDAEDLVPVLVEQDGSWEREVLPDRVVDGESYQIQRYRPRIEGLFARIERWRHRGTGDVHWRSISRDNILALYGKDAESRICDPLDPTRIFSWLICESRDDKGNAVVYRYKSEDGAGVDLSRSSERNRGAANDPRRSANRYLKRVLYGNRVPLLNLAGRRPDFLEQIEAAQPGWMFELVFDYGEHDASTPAPNDAGSWSYRVDPFSTHRAGFEVRTTRLCERALMFHHFPGEAGVGQDCLVRSTDFTYSHEQDPANVRNPIYTFLRSVTQNGYRRRESGYDKRSMPAVELEYTLPLVQDEIREVDPKSLENLPIGADDAFYQWSDLHGEGIPGILSEQAGAWFYKRNLSALADGAVELAATERVAAKPNLDVRATRAQFMDLAGDGQPDLVVLDGFMPGVYEHDDAESWQRFRPFPFRLDRSVRDPNLRFVDLDGDGHADVLIAEGDAFVWHASLAEEGFGPARRLARALDEEKGPCLVFSDDTQSLHLADMCGDGLADIVRIRNGEVCYWPNLGYGRFGAKVTMDRSPHFDHPDQFDHKRIRLADIDGTGTNDIIYLHRDGVRLYFNQSGNGWSEPQILRALPAVDDIASLVTTDLLGNGTACLVWSSPLPRAARKQMRYVSLMGAEKPHLLFKAVNNLGAETRVRYAPSTRFYLQDKRDGKPWITRLPFPVHVVERIETYDHIGRNRFVTRYAYHHGYFDGEEREFRGFGMMEQWDTEEVGALDGGVFPEGDNFNSASDMPPVYTKTWFHTGVYLGRDRISDFFAGLLGVTDSGEYFREPGLTDAEARSLLLPDTVLPEGLTSAEAREACRALKGSMLRQEIYALDGSASEAYPYSVTEKNFGIRVVQPKTGNRHAVFFTHAREAVSFHYERNPADPRIQHGLTLEVDAYGNVLKQATVGYGRREADAALPTEADRDKQARTYVTYSESRVTNAIDLADSYRTPLSCESRTYEVTGLTVSPGARFTLQQLAEAGGAANEIEYQVAPSEGQLQRRLIEHTRSYYRRDDLTGPLPLGELQSLAVSFGSCQLAFTPGLLAQVYADRVTDAMLVDARYVHSEGDDNWWIHTGRSFFSSDAGDTPAQELAFARQHFFLPHRFEDVFGNSSRIRYDAHDLLLLESEDALQNKVTAGERDTFGNIVPGNDYRVLAPTLITDANGNRSEVVFDTLGMLVGTAVMGKSSETLGDSLAGFEPDIDEATLLADFQNPLAAPHALLQQATTRLVYDVFAYQRTRNDPQPQPARVHILARETHQADLAPDAQTAIQHSFTYSDGFGREIQTKKQAEPGPLIEGGVEVSPRWVGTGWTIFNNKGKPIRTYEPCFSATHDFEFANIVGVGLTLFYDPVGRAVGTAYPNHTYDKVVFDPWRQETWDVNDTVAEADPRNDADVGGFFRRLADADYLPTWHANRAGGQLGSAEQDAALKAAAHANTPAVVHVDSLERAFLTIADNSTAGKFESRVEYDIEGNSRAVTDAKNRVVMCYDYDMLGNRIRQASMEAGTRWAFNDAAGKQIYRWDGRGHVTRTTYDQLQRAVDLFVQEGNGPERLVEHVIYGEASGEALNHRGRVFQQFDSAGTIAYDAYDFKGNLSRSTRRVAADYQNVLDWSANPQLQSEEFVTETTFDALNRPVTLKAPDDSLIRPTYNEATLLERVEVNLRGANTATVFVSDIGYDAKGQREFIVYGSGVLTQYDYDPLTFRLVRLQTLRGTERLQDLQYTHDPVGNITAIRDDAQQTIYFSNQAVEPHADYTYDAIYRLIAATGREHIGQQAQPQTSWNDSDRIHLPHPHDGQAMRRYSEQYEYDEVGNLLNLIHQANNANWTRACSYDAPSLVQPAVMNNRLSGVSVGNITETFAHDAHGNMTQMPHLALLEWDHNDRLQTVDLGGGGTAYYVYDAAGRRVRKVIERQNGTRQKERVYLGDFEIYREYGGDGNTVSLQRETLLMADGTRRIAVVDTKTFDAAGPGSESQPAIRYQLANHLGSASLELDEAGQIISYEEYFPYGSTAYQAGRSAAEVSLKRYRYAGKERDEETGLSLHGARYYAAWLCRWVSCDPVDIAAGLNLYQYGNLDPIGLVDTDGADPKDPDRSVFGAIYDTGVELFGENLPQAQIVKRWGSAIDTYQKEGAWSATKQVAGQVASASPLSRMVKGPANFISDVADGNEVGDALVNTYDKFFQELPFGKSAQDMSDMRTAYEQGESDDLFAAAMKFVNHHAKDVADIALPVKGGKSNTPSGSNVPTKPSTAPAKPTASPKSSAPKPSAPAAAPKSTAPAASDASKPAPASAPPETPTAAAAEPAAAQPKTGPDWGGLRQHHLNNVRAEQLLNSLRNLSKEQLRQYLDRGVGRMDLGQALQKGTAESMQKSGMPVENIQQPPGKSVPDHLNLGKGPAFHEVTTIKALQAHLQRWYAPYVKWMLYEGPPRNWDPQLPPDKGPKN